MFWKNLFSDIFYPKKKQMRMPPSAIIPFKQTTWKPGVANGDGTVYDSKFAGMPGLSPNEIWPVCQNCGEPMTFFLQLNLESLPEALNGEFGTGLLQLFYCTNSDPLCEVECDAFFPFAKSQLVRVIQINGISQRKEIPENTPMFPSKRIIDWQKMDDYPNWEEGGQHGVNLTDAEWEVLAMQDFPRSGDKLAGWPHWIQGLEYPDCPVCGGEMRMVFQIDSNDHLPYMFGDLGCGHITQCPTHRTQVAFGWACS